MDFLITEKQLSKILLENVNDDLTNSLKKMYSFTQDMVKTVMKAYGLNIRMFLTWGTSVGGLMLPLDEFIKTGNFDLTDDQRMLVLAGVSFIIFFEGKRGINKILSKIKEEGIKDQFETVLKKGIELNSAFQEFFSTIISSSGVFLEVIAYSFLIPIITDIFELSQGAINIQETATLIAERLLASGVSLVGKETMTGIMKRLIRKFK
jgi:hypothetical protein